MADMGRPLRTVERVLASTRHTVLELLLAADTWIDESELAGAIDGDPGRVLRTLVDQGVIERTGPSCRLHPAVQPEVRTECGEPSRAAWLQLTSIARRELAARPGDSNALALAVRAQARSGDAAAALALLASHPAARHRMSATLMADTVRDVARSAPETATDGHVAFAREMFRRGEFETARRSLEELPIASLAVREVRLLRAHVLLRAGALTAARRDLALAGGPGDLEIAILGTLIDVMAGKFAHARTS